jgi:hypothetical protein
VPSIRFEGSSVGARGQYSRNFWRMSFMLLNHLQVSTMTLNEWAYSIS